MLIAHISDFHCTAKGTLAFGAFDTNTALENAVARLKSMTPRPDLVIITGDLTNSERPEEYDVVTEALANLDLPVFAIPGNHDDRDELRRVFRNAGFFSNEGFLHHTVENYPVRIVALDTLVPGKPHGDQCAERLEWLDRTLAEQPNRPTLIAMHHPPVPLGIAYMDATSCGNSDQFRAIVDRNPQVKLILCGHLHRPITSRVGRVPLVVAPSTANHLAFDPSPSPVPAWTREPSAIALHLWRNNTFVSHLVPVQEWAATAF